MRGHLRQEDIATAATHAYQQLGSFSRLSDAEWWAIWRLGRHQVLVEGARRMIDAGNLCMSCGLPMLGEYFPTPVSARAHPECMQQLGQNHLSDFFSPGWAHAA